MGKAQVLLLTAVAILLTLAPSAQGEIAPIRPTQRSANPPGWVHAPTRCSADLTGTSPSGVVGYIGYNVTSLAIVARQGVGCRQAKLLARENWVNGPEGQTLHWRYLRAWRSTSGSAYVGDFVGRDGDVRVEYHAIH